MDRLFTTHLIRREIPLYPVWTLRTLDEGGLDGPEDVWVSGAWESDPRLRSYRGRGEYSQTIRCGGNIRIWAGGVGFRAGVYLDGRLLREHYGAYTGFEAIACGLPEGEHCLQIIADNRFAEDSALHIPNDYYAYGGITRPVTVERIGDVYIASLCALPVRNGGRWIIQACVTVRNLSAEPVSADVSLSAGEAGEQQTVMISSGETTEIPFEMACGNVREWTPEDPALYPVQAILFLNGEPMDDLIDRIGFRTVRVEGNRILLNDRPLKLRGFNRHEEYGSFGSAVPPEAMMQDLQMMRDLGANCVRTCHYPNDPRFLDLCDETGMLVWEESHARGLQEEQMKHPKFMEQLRMSTREMLEQHINHPCIFIWGSLNECGDNTEFGAECYREIFSMIRQADGSRPVTAALLERPGCLVYGDLDVVSVNIYPGWYYNGPVTGGLDRKLEEAGKGGGAGKPVIISEIGAGAIYGFHDPFGQAKWSEERQCAILKEQIRAIMNRPDITGLFLWQFADCRVDEEWAIHRPKTHNNKGIVDEYRRPKMAYETVKQLFGWYKTR
jgi:beta-glucuronidase